MNKHPKHLGTGLFIMILIAGSALRFANLDTNLQGYSADEAATITDVLTVLDGDLRIAYGDAEGYHRGPVFSVITGAGFTILGNNPLVARATAATLSIILLVLTYVWVRSATQNQWLALATMGGLATSFWSVVTSRAAVTNLAMPVLFMAAAVSMRRSIEVEEDLPDDFVPPRYRPTASVESWIGFVLTGIFLGISFYTHPTASIMWLIFPTFFIFLSIDQPGVIRKAWPGLIVSITLAVLIGAPLIAFILRNPNISIIGFPVSPAESIINAGPLAVRDTVRHRLGIIALEGDPLWQYNIADKSLLDPLFSLLFYMGVSIAIMSQIAPYRLSRRGMRNYSDSFRITSANAFMLLTLGAGLLPALMHGTPGSNILAIGAQPALYYFPALAVLWLTQWAKKHTGLDGEHALTVSYGIALAISALITTQAYFGTWAHSPEVRDIYNIPAESVMNSGNKP